MSTSSKSERITALEAEVQLLKGQLQTLETFINLHLSTHNMPKPLGDHGPWQWQQPIPMWQQTVPAIMCKSNVSATPPLTYHTNTSGD